MPNQSDRHYTELGFNIDHQKKMLILKQVNPDRVGIIRIYHIKISRIISSYIEGPFRLKENQNIYQDDMWRFVITVHQIIDNILYERDIVLYLDSKDYAESSLDTFNEMIGM